MIFDYTEGNVILSALWDFDEYFLPRFVPRELLFKLIKKLMDELQIKYDEEGIPTPNLYEEKYDRSKDFEMDLTADEIDLINRAIDAGDFKAGVPQYPRDIQDAADRVYLKTKEALGEEDHHNSRENQDLFYEVFFSEPKD